MLQRKILILFLSFPLWVNSQQLAKYRYWFDDSFSTAQTVSSTDTLINLSLNVTSLSPGFHQLNFQSKDANDLWSSVSASYFYHADLGVNNINIFRYWFDNDSANVKTKYIVTDSTNDFSALIDVEELSLGQHKLNYQFSDTQGEWTAILTDTITRAPVTQKIFIEPKVFIKKATLNVGEIQTITGSDFTYNGLIKLFVQDNKAEFLETNNSLSYLPNGKFSYQLPITSAMPDGEYKVYALDVNLAVSSPLITFNVKNPVQRKVWIRKPLGGDSYLADQTFLIQWGDYIDKSLAVGKSGFVLKSYKIELSDDNGINWAVIENAHAIKNAIQGINNNNFSSSHSIATTGTYMIRITDNENPANFSISESFEITGPGSHGFSTQLGWDFSSPDQSRLKVPPTGLAADGTCRIFIKLLRSPGNFKKISSINAEIKPVNSSYSTTDLLGRILYATDTVSYSVQGNDAKATSTFYQANGNGDKGAYWFWLVAPDDFTEDLNNFHDNTRKINTEFTITYSDNSTEIVSTQNLHPIEIIRPILFLVHGLNSNTEAFQNAGYLDHGKKVYFDGTGELNPLWQIVNRIHLHNYASFGTNAEVFLGIGNNLKNDYHNTFQYNLNEMHKKGYASNRVDYVCHSMGGDVARTMINIYPGAYNPRPDPNSIYTYKNYGRGFINKLITLNTPHNGSYLADLFMDRWQSSGAINGYSLFQTGFFHNLFPSDAIKDLQAYHGGIRFRKTVQTKNHEIGSIVDGGKITDNESLLGQSKILLNNKKPGIGYGLLLPYFSFSINSYIASRYGNSEYLGQTDMVVPESSQFPNTNQLILDLHNSVTDISTASILKNINTNHLNITDDPLIGSRIMTLLNAPINSGFFADTIAANNNIGIGGTIYRTSLIQDSVINYRDTTVIKIIEPISQSIVYVDSTLRIKVNIKDTSGLQRIRVAFQTEFYDSYSKATNQIFDVKTNSNSIGKNVLFAEATCDSAGVIINHADTITLNVISLDTLKGFYLYPKSQNLNRQHAFQLDYNAVYTNYVGALNKDIDSLSFKIVDNDVVRFDSINQQFITKDTGTTHIIFKYKNFSDTAFIYISESDASLNALPVTLISFTGYAQPAFNQLEWKTSSEINFSRFIVQRSLDGNNWINIGKVNSLSNSNSGINNYTYADSSILNILSYYRLQLVDIDGAIKISNVVIIRRNNSKSKINVFPNPVTKGDLYIDFGQSVSLSKVTVNVFDLTGKVVKTVNQVVQSGNLMRLDLHALKPSVYMLKIQKGNDIQTLKIDKVE